MKIQIKFFALGFIAACMLGLGSILCLLFFSVSDNMIFHDQVLPSGKNIKVTSCNFAWGLEHDDRSPNKDCFTLEYVSSTSDSDLQVRDQETVEVFELIRPISELWGLDKSEVSVFPSTKRKGIYDIYLFKRNSDGKWTFNRHSAKVHIND